MFDTDGIILGPFYSIGLGPIVGTWVGVSDGIDDGWCDGLRLIDGLLDGLIDGSAEGSNVGDSQGASLGISLISPQLLTEVLFLTTPQTVSLAKTSFKFSSSFSMLSCRSSRSKLSLNKRQIELKE